MDRVSQLFQKQTKAPVSGRNVKLNNNFVLMTLAEAAYIISFWSSATDPKSDSWRRCQETSSTTAVWPVKIVLASTIFPSLGTVLISHRHIVCKEHRGMLKKKKRTNK